MRAEEMTRIEARPPLYSFGLWMLGPVLLEYANEEQKKEHLPKIARGELRLQSMGVTEPGAGTDTTAIRTSAVRKGDRYVVNGQKVWISRVQHSDLMILLARTAPAAAAGKRSEGLSIFLVAPRIRRALDGYPLPSWCRTAVAVSAACGLGTARTDALVEAVRNAGWARGLAGARVSGGGSGGTVVILGREDAEPLVREIVREFGADLVGGSSAGAAGFLPGARFFGLGSRSLVAFSAARIATLFGATITSTFCFTSPFTSAGIRSNWPSACRCIIEMFLPST